MIVLFKRAWMLIKQDKIILTPYLFLSLLYSLSFLILKHYHIIQIPKSSAPFTVGSFFNIGIFLMVFFILGLFIKIIVTIMATQLSSNHSITIKNEILLSFKIFGDVISSVLIIVLPLLVFGIIGLYNFHSILAAYHYLLMNFPKNLLYFAIVIMGIIFFLMIVFISLVVEFIPISIYLFRQNFYQGFKFVSFFIFKNFNKIMSYFGFIFFIRLFVLGLLLIMSQILAQGDAVVEAFAQGLTDTFITILGTLFFMGQTTDNKTTIDIKI